MSPSPARFIHALRSTCRHLPNALGFTRPRAARVGCKPLLGGSQSVCRRARAEGEDGAMRPSRRARSTDDDVMCSPMRAPRCVGGAMVAPSGELVQREQARHRGKR
jgi:hypothetical protein